MSFTGDLEHLSIVDVVQLLHATRKSGTLTVKSRKGESQIVFNDGYIISANHFDNSVRVGNILVEAGVITAETLARALRDQESAGEGRRPLIATLIEQGKVKKEDAYRGLEALIELTIVEILTWKRGTFTLDVENFTASDEYRYFPEKLHQEITLHTENVLMDALRIYDEKKRDGLLVDEELTEEEFADESPAGFGDQMTISAADLGLEDVDKLKKSIPRVFAGLEDRTPERRIQELGTDLSEREREELLAFLGAYTAPARDEDGTAPAVILFSADELMTYCVTTVCRHEGIFVFATNEEQDLAPIIEQSLAKGSTTVLVFDTPEGAGERFSAEKIASLRRQKREKYPQVAAVQLVSPLDYVFTLDSLRDGARAAIPRPVRAERGETFLEDTLRFLGTLPAYLKALGHDRGNAPVARLRSAFTELRQAGEPPEVALALLNAVAGLCERSLTLIVRETELIAERSIGIRGEKGEGATQPLRFRIPLQGPSLFRRVIEKGGSFFGKTDDEVVKEHLFAAIGAPLHPTVLLLPLKSFGKTISLTYGDFGGRETAPLPAELLEILAAQAGLAVENALYRKKREKASV